MSVAAYPPKVAGCKSGSARVPARREDVPPSQGYFRLRLQRALGFCKNGSRGRDPSQRMSRFKDENGTPNAERQTPNAKSRGHGKLIDGISHEIAHCV